MKKITTAITLNASPEQVWEVLMNFEAYPSWNPFITSIQGEAKLGNQLVNTINIEGQKQQVFKPEIIALKPGKHFAWRGKLFVKGLFDGEHHFHLQPNSDGNTEFIHEEMFSGMLAGPLMSMIGEKTRNGFEAMNHALAEQVKKNVLS
ncbi:MAG: SRPBCC family protein [Bacteroidia bacterium]